MTERKYDFSALAEDWSPGEDWPPGERYDRAVWSVSAGLLDEVLGRTLTDDELDRCYEAIPNSTILELLSLMLAGMGIE